MLKPETNVRKHRIFRQVNYGQLVGLVIMVIWGSLFYLKYSRWNNNKAFYMSRVYGRGFQTMGRDPNLGRKGFKFGSRAFAWPQKIKK